jgi:hypothetical protein
MYTNPVTRTRGDFAERRLRELTDDETALVGGSGGSGSVNTSGNGSTWVNGGKKYTLVQTGCNTFYWAVEDPVRGLSYTLPAKG